MIHLSHPTGILKGNIQLPASKSISNRCLILQYAIKSEVELQNLSEANDTQLLKKILSQLNHFTEINAEDAGTTYRFLTALLACQKGTKILIGEKQMHSRPVGDLVEALRVCGAEISYLEKEGFPPLEIKGSSLSPPEIIDFSKVKSSQFISAMLLISPLIDEGKTLKIKINPEMNSKSFLNLTLKVLGLFGVQAKCTTNEIHVKCGQVKTNTKTYHIEPDWTSFYYWLAMAMHAKEVDLHFDGLILDSLQEESKLLSALEISNIEIIVEKEGLRMIKNKNQVAGSDVAKLPLKQFPDLWPTLAFMWAPLKKKVKATGLDWLKYKESNRLEAVQFELSKLNVSITESPKGTVAFSSTEFTRGPRLYIDTYDDHRIAMSAAILGVQQPLTISNPQVVKKSYPSFWEDLSKVGFNIEEV